MIEAVTFSEGKLLELTNALLDLFTYLKLWSQLLLLFVLLSDRNCPHPPTWLGRCLGPVGYFWPSVAVVYQETVVTLDSCERFDRSTADLSPCLQPVVTLSLDLSLSSYPSGSLSLSMTDHH